MAVDEIAKYDNELNSIPLSHLTRTETNLFFSIISKMRDRGTEKVRFYFDELKNLSDYRGKNMDRFIDSMLKLYKKMLTLNFGITSKNGLVHEQFIMFSEFKIDAESEYPYVDIKIYEKAVPLLNELSTWVRFSLKEFNDIHSVYAKTLFRLFKQFRTTGKVILPVEKFNELLDVPKSYKQWHVNTKILKPAMEELSKYFDNLKVEKEYFKKRGRPLKSYTFTFKPDKKEKFIDNKFEKNSYQKPHQEISTNWESHIPKKEKNKEGISNKLSDLLGELD